MKLRLLKLDFHTNIYLEEGNITFILIGIPNKNIL